MTARGIEKGTEIETETGTGTDTETETVTGMIDIEMTGEGTIVTDATIDGKKEGGPALANVFKPHRVPPGKNPLCRNPSLKTRK